MPGRIVRISVTVKEAHRGCKVHHAGDTMTFECVGSTCVKPEGTICLGALTSLMPKVYAFHNNARFHWADADDVVVHACPDPATPVVFEVRREYAEK